MACYVFCGRVESAPPHTDMIPVEQGDIDEDIEKSMVIAL